MTALKVEEHIPIKQGIFYGEIGGVHFGSDPHIHFYFIWGNKNFETALDPWILFWKIFENNKKRSNQIDAVMNPLSPAKAGEEILFNAENSKKGIYGSELSYFWSINDGAFYEGKTASHKFQKEGMYVVTLTITDGADTASVSQHITINKGQKPKDYLVLHSPDLFDFKTRTLAETDTYGEKGHKTGNYLHFYFRKRAEYSPMAKKVIIEGSPKVLKTLDIQLEYLHYDDWINIERKNDTLIINLKKEKLSHALGKYYAKVTVSSKKTGLKQHFYVEAENKDHRYPPWGKSIVSNNDVLFYPSEFYWVEEAYDKKYLKGYGAVKLWAGNENETGVARYQPELLGGKYKIYLHEKAIAEPKFSEIKTDTVHVQILTTTGLKDIYWQPKQNRELGIFELYGGKDSYIDILTKGSTGQIYLDALIFEKTDKE